MYIIVWLIFGAIVGWLASILMSKNGSMGLFSNILFGIIGSILGMWLMDVFGFGRPDTFSIEGFLVSVGGAALLILLISVIRKR